MRKKKDRRNLKIGIIIISLVILISLIYIFGVRQTIYSPGNLGDWTISKYENKELTIPINVNANSYGWLGAFTMHDKGTNSITNKKDCEEIGFTWRTKDLAGDGFQCYLYNENWFRDKSYSSNVRYTDTCVDPNGCGCARQATGANPECLEFITSGTTYTGDYNPSFNGFTIYFERSGSNSWSRTYTGELRVIVPNDFEDDDEIDDDEDDDDDEDGWDYYKYIGIGITLIVIILIVFIVIGIIKRRK